MGKALIIKGADFSSVSAGQVITGYNPVGVVDLTQYTNSHMAVVSAPSLDPYRIVENLSAADSYIVPVVPGEQYRVKFCGGSMSYVVLGITGDEFVIVSNHVVNHSADIEHTGTDPEYGTRDFTIPTGTDSIFICGRNSSHADFVAGYALTLTRLS